MSLAYLLEKQLGYACTALIDDKDNHILTTCFFGLLGWLCEDGWTRN